MTSWTGDDNLNHTISYLGHSSVKAGHTFHLEERERLVSDGAVGNGVGSPGGDQMEDAGMALAPDLIRRPAHHRAQVHLVLEKKEKIELNFP